MKFEKGHWNIDELEIQEWLDTKTKGFMKEDVEHLKEKLLEDIDELGTIDFKTEKEAAACKVITHKIREIINKRFGGN